jgi:hypothetical protein
MDPKKRLQELIKKAELELDPEKEKRDSLAEIEKTVKEDKKMTAQVVGLDVLTIKGDKGEKGDRGDVGEKGDRGEPGQDGVDGKDGIDGLDGLDGKDGVGGIDGKDGMPGERGEKGDKGDPGKDADPAEVIEVMKALPEKKRLDISHLRNSTQIQSAISKMIKGGGITGVNTNKITVSATAPQDPIWGDLWVDVS